MAATFSFTPLRYKGPDSTNDVDADDPDFATLNLPPNTGAYTVASAENGTFSIVAARARGGAAAGTSSYEHAASETDAETAEALADQINADIAAGTAGTLYGFAERAHYPGTGAVLYVQWKQDVAPFFVSTVDPGSATLTQATMGDRWPASTSVVAGNRVGGPPATDIEVTVVAIDSDGVPIAPGSCTYTLEFLDAYTVDGQWAVSSRGSLSGALGEIHAVAMNGSKQFGVRLSSIANEPAGTDQIVVLWRAVVG